MEVVMNLSVGAQFAYCSKFDTSLVRTLGLDSKALACTLKGVDVRVMRSRHRWAHKRLIFPLYMSCITH